jgi:hypothetical protein
MESVKNTTKLLNFISDKFESGQLDNDSLVQLIELCGSYLNLMTISDYARNNNLSYNGVKKCRKIVKIFNVKFIIDND